MTSLDAILLGLAFVWGSGFATGIYAGWKLWRQMPVALGR